MGNKKSEKASENISLTNDVFEFENINESFDYMAFEFSTLENFNGDYAAYTESLKKELKHFQKHYATALEQVDSLRRKNRDLQTMYDSVAGSTVWKLTKPIRLILDLIKYPFKIHLGQKIAKFFKYWRKYGLKYALAKVRQNKLAKKQIQNISILISEDRRILESKTKFPEDIKISILVPLYNTPHEFLVQMVESVMTQTYQNFELCLADGSTPEFSDVEKTCMIYAAKDSRVKYKKLEKNLGISQNTNACIDIATGDYIALFDHDDLLHPSALFEVMKAITEEGADYVYTDEVTFESPNVDKLLSVHYKPDFAKDNLRANNYICHFSVFKRELLEKSGRFRSEYDGSQDHDMILRLTSNAKKVVHIPKILYFWRSHPLSVAMDINSKTYAIKAGQNAVKTDIEASGYTAKVESTKVFPAMYRIKYDIKSEDKVSLIIYAPKEPKVLEKAIEMVEGATYKNTEIIVATDDNLPNKLSSLVSSLEESGKIKVYRKKDATYPTLINGAAEVADGKYLLFLDGGVVPLAKNFIEELLMYAQRDDVAFTAGALYYSSNAIRHAGYILGHGENRTIARMFYGINNSSIGYMGRLWYSQNLSAVSLEITMVKKETFFKIGALSEDYRLIYYDADICLKAKAAGWLTVWTPYSNGYTYTAGLAKSKSNFKMATTDAKLFKERWQKTLDAGDPYYNSNFSIESADFTV